MFTNFRKEGRIEALDLLKVFAAFLVVFGHCLMKYAIGSTSTPLYNFIWLTQMPLFMFVSGFTNTKFEKVNSVQKYLLRVIKNALTLVFPCITFLLIISIIDQNNFGELVIGFLKDPTQHLWFLWVLFLIRIVFEFGLFIGSKIKNRFKITVPIIASLCAALIIVASIYLSKGKFDGAIIGLKLVAYYTPFYCLGYLFNLLIKSNLLEKKPINIISYVAIGLMASVLVFECFYFKSIYEFDDSKISLLLIRVIGSFCATGVCVFLADILCKFKTQRIISRCGSFSLESFYIHILFLRHMNFSAGNGFIFYFESFGISLLLIALIALIIAIMYFVPYMHLLFFGKSFSRYEFEKKLPKILR